MVTDIHTTTALTLAAHNYHAYKLQKGPFQHAGPMESGIVHAPGGGGAIAAG